MQSRRLAGLGRSGRRHLGAARSGAVPPPRDRAGRSAARTDAATRRRPARRAGIRARSPADDEPQPAREPLAQPDLVAERRQAPGHGLRALRAEPDLELAARRACVDRAARAQQVHRAVLGRRSRTSSGATATAKRSAGPHASAAERAVAFARRTPGTPVVGARSASARGARSPARRGPAADGTPPPARASAACAASAPIAPGTDGPDADAGARVTRRSPRPRTRSRRGRRCTGAHRGPTSSRRASLPSRRGMKTSGTPAPTTSACTRSFVAAPSVASITTTTSRRQRRRRRRVEPLDDALDPDLGPSEPPRGDQSPFACPTSSSPKTTCRRQIARSRRRRDRPAGAGSRTPAAQRHRGGASDAADADHEDRRRTHGRRTAHRRRRPSAASEATEPTSGRAQCARPRPPTRLRPKARRGSASGSEAIVVCS